MVAPTQLSTFKSDLTLAGEGTLKVEGKYEEGIHTPRLAMPPAIWK